MIERFLLPFTARNISPLIASICVFIIRSANNRIQPMRITVSVYRFGFLVVHGHLPRMADAER
jgi:hypothetical protein